MKTADPFLSFATRLGGLIETCPQDSGTSQLPFNDLALELFRLQFGHNPVYRRQCEWARVTPQAVSDWSDIPSLPTSAFKEWEVTSIPARERERWFCSSGTTAQRPSRHFHNHSSLGIYERSLWGPFARHLLPEGTPVGRELNWILLTPPPHQTPHSSLIHMFESVRARTLPEQWAYFGEVGAGGDWELNLDSVLSALSEAQRQGRPVLLLGTAFLFLNLLDELARLRLRFKLPAGSRALETGGYKGRTRSVPRAELHTLMNSRLNLEPNCIVCEYGMAELSSQAYDRIAGQSGPRTLNFPPWVRAVAVSPETGSEVADGETGLLRIFDLANVYSVLAIQTEDLAIRRGSGFELLGRAPQAEPRGCSLMAA
jgi:hypothetical protein